MQILQKLRRYNQIRASRCGRLEAHGTGPVFYAAMSGLNKLALRSSVEPQIVQPSFGRMHSDEALATLDK